jgi:CBS domain-containing protein
MKISDIMTSDVTVARPGDTVKDVAGKMADLDVGSLPVCDGSRLLGMVTDRDITIRAVARGLGGDTPITEIMTAEVEYAFADVDLKDVADKMSSKQIRRLPVVDADKRLIGIVAIADIARQDRDKRVGDTVEQISRPGHVF